MSSDERRNGLTRRAFLRGAAGTVGAVALGGCTTADPDGAAAPTGGQGTAGPTGGEQAGASGGRPTIRIQGGQFALPHPFRYIAAPGYWRVSYLFDTLLWADSTGEQMPWLASSHEVSGDGMVHTLELREADWHDGTPLTVEDVIFTMEYSAAQRHRPLAVAAPRNIAEIVAVGGRTIEIRLEQPDVMFTKRVLGSVPIIPQHIWSQIDDPQAADDDETLIGTGPYRLTFFDNDEGRLQFTANDDYFLGAPYVEKIEMVWVDDELVSTRVGELDGGQAPVEGVRDDVLDPFREDPDFGVIANETAFAFPLYWNLSRGGALADVQFRRACLMAIDRDDLVRRLLTGNGEVGNPGFLPPTHPFHVDVEQYAYDPDQANRILDDAGYRRPDSGAVRQAPDGTPLSFELITHATAPAALPDLLKATLADVGIELRLRNLELPQLFAAKTAHDYDMLVNLYPGPVGTTPNSDPDILRPVYHSEPPNQLYNASGYANDDVDRLLEEQVATFDEDERMPMIADIQRQVAEDLPVAILYYTTMFFVYRKDVFDQWYYTEKGFGPGIPDAYNKHMFVTGRKTGLDIRQPTGG